MTAMAKVFGTKHKAKDVYFESGTACYENINNRAGYILPVRSLKE